MSNLIRTRAKDGTLVEFIYKDPKQGGVKDVYFAPDKRYVVAFFRKKLDVIGKERIEKIVNIYRDRIFDNEGGEYWKKRFCWPEKIVEYDGKMGIIVPAYDKEFFFGPNSGREGAEKEGLWFASAKNFNRYLNPEDRGDLTGYLRVCLQLSRGVRRLHSAGLAHSDLSYKNCLVNPVTGNACIIDIDGLVVPGLFPPDVYGTPKFIAPEVEMTRTMNYQLNDKRRKLPRRETDQHALAVLNYLYLFHRHPLEGGKVYDLDDDVQSHLEYGERALFIEHPLDRSNRPKLDTSDKPCQPWCDVDKIPYTCVGPHLKKCFDKAFIDGLHSPEKRPTANNWEDALMKTVDNLLPCPNKSCMAKWFIFDNCKRPICPYCGTPYRGTVPVLDLFSSRRGNEYQSDDHHIIIWSNQSLYRWHTNRLIVPNEKLRPEDQNRVGFFSFFRGKWIFVNQKLTRMKNITTGKSVAPGSAVELTEGLRLLFDDGPSGRLAQIRIVKGS